MEIPDMRNLTHDEIELLVRGGNVASDWSTVLVSSLFVPSSIVGSRFEGIVEIEDDVEIRNSLVANYHIGRGTTIDSVTRLECRHESAFGNGVEVATVNECGGRSVAIFASMSAQAAYLAAMWRERTALQSALRAIAGSYASSVRSAIGRVGRNCRLVGAGIIRETWIGDGVTIEGSSMLENGTILDGSRVGVDVRAYDFIIAQDASVDNGSVLRRCFVGERTKVDSCFTAVDTLMFSGCHFENGEAVSVFAGPYTVSHHKSSLLIAGYFSFFNAGSGTNQSNHLFKEGAVHQSIHLRGTKFASNGYVMSPAREGAFSLVMGRNVKHHDTANMPFSYLIGDGTTTTLVPAIAIDGYGTERDNAKWPSRDCRGVRRDIVDYAEFNPYIAWYVSRGVDDLKALSERYGDAEKYTYNGTVIKSSMAERAVRIYSRYLRLSIAQMLERGTLVGESDGRWVDAAGQYISKSALERIVHDVESGMIAGADGLNDAFAAFENQYESHAYSWAWNAFREMLGHEPAPRDLEELRSEAAETAATLRSLRESDRSRDRAADMSVGYGIDGDEEVRAMEFEIVRKIE